MTRIRFDAVAFALVGAWITISALTDLEVLGYVCAGLALVAIALDYKIRGRGR